MSGRPRKFLSNVKRDDRLWTEEEGIEFGLAAEEEFCDVPLAENDVPFASEESAVVEDMAACEEALTEHSTEMELMDYKLLDTNTTKSGRIRKKSAKLMEMEESDRLERIFVDPSSKSDSIRSSRRQRFVPLDYTIDETLEQSYVAGMKPSSSYETPTRFGLGSSDQAARRERKRRKLSESEFIDPDSEFENNLVIDEPRGVAMQNIDNRPIHMKLSMRPDMTASITHSSTSEFVSAEEGVGLSSPRKSRKASKRVSEITDIENDYGRESIADVHMYHSRLHLRHKTKLGKVKKKRQKGYTAYMLWCSTMREKFVAQNPGIDFANVSKLLGDAWHTVPEKEKKIYRRKARKLSKMAKKGVIGSLNSTEKSSEVISADGRVARVGTGRPVGRPPVHGYRRNAAEELGPGCKVIGIGPIDVAAHLKLLGESLTTIGNRLQEHRGRIAVQGSLSVLLDSLLCTLGPLMCLTAQVPHLNGCPDYVHASTLNNIAYIMPGIG